MNLATLLRDVSKSIPEKVAILVEAQEITYGELWSRIERLSGAFHRLGISENARVVLALPNGPDFVCCFFALISIKAIVVPINAGLTPFEQKRIYDDLNPHAIISTLTSIEGVAREYPEIILNRLLVSQGSIPGQRQSARYFRLEDLYRATCKNTYAGIRPDQIATINYTYRGIGIPLGAMMTHSNYMEGVSAYVENTRMASEHRVLSLLPMHLVYPLVGCILAPLFQGATVVILKNVMPRSILKSIREYSINHFAAVPTIYVLLSMLFNSREYGLSSLSCCITGASHMSSDLQDGIKAKTGLDVYQGYGLTECLPVTWNRYEYNRVGTLGLPLRPDFHIRIVGEDGKICRNGQAGEINIKGPTVMQGYLNQKDFAGSVLRDGWLSTGDFGFVDKDGYLYFSGIKKKIAKVGGNMVDLTEVRDILLSHPGICSVEVYPVQDDLWGHIIGAKISRVNNAKLAENEIRKYCSQYISHYKVPRIIEFMFSGA